MMNKSQEKQLRETLNEQYKRHFTRGLSQGTKAMCGVILEMAENTSKDNAEIINDIIAFCRTRLRLPKQK